MKCLITGGAGFIGSHLADYLIAKGHDVHALDDLSAGSMGNVAHLLSNQHFKITVGSVLDPRLFRPIMAKCDQVYHLAAAVGVRQVIKDRVRSIRNNILATERVLELAALYGKKVFIASTSEVYGKLMHKGASAQALCEEGDRMIGPTSVPRWAYACTKALDEFLALAYHREQELHVVIGRFFNTVGPRQTARYGMVIPRFVSAALTGAPLTVYGDGTQKRCFLHVHDATRAITALMENSAAEGGIFNIGSKIEISINDLAQKVRALTDSNSKIVYLPYEQVYGGEYVDLYRRIPDLVKTCATINWEPRIQLSETLREVISYERARKHIIDKLGTHAPHLVSA
ncbi:MAG TPA: GDP-mannose 4,6-dehydratase [Rhodothermales bacterium]|nr:GDP-mannose 4,6-dehydratase [Rhodothermales bacterium]